MQTDTTYINTRAQQGASYPGPYGRGDYMARSEDALPQQESTAPLNGGSAYQPLSVSHQKENTAGEDIYRMRPNVTVEYDEVFKEPSSHGRYFSIAWLNRLIFTKTKIAVYVVFSVLLGVVLSFLWGIFFAVLNFFDVYLLQPSAKWLFIWLRSLSMISRAIVRSFLDPFYESFGIMFSRIRGSFSLNASGFLPIVAKNECAPVQEIKQY